MKLTINKQLEQIGISKYELAKRLNVTYPTIMKICNGELTSIRFKTLEKLCRVLNCTPNDILIMNKDDIE